LSAEAQSGLQDRRTRFDDYLRLALRRTEGWPLPLCEAMSYGLLAPGKRLRPLLTIMAAETCGGRAEQAFPAGCAVEMVHAYSLIHDDLPAMDDDDLRRGQPTVHKKFGEAIAILAGDALLTLAFEVLASEYNPATAAACCRELAVAAGGAGMVGGQVQDLTWEGKIEGRSDEASVERLESIHSAKTGALFRVSLRLGLLAVQGEREAGPDPRLRAALDEFGRCFGLAFQILDDLLDVEGEVAATGKRVRKDAAHGKLTYPSLLGVTESRDRARRLAEQGEAALQLLGNDAEPLVSLMRSMIERDR
jgi:geranylgeranyl diphosphate synthase, type II